jgi:hypothetical protein
MTGRFWRKAGFFQAGCWLLFAFLKLGAQSEPAPEVQADLLAKADSILESVSNLSGLPIRDNVPIEFKDRDFFEHYYASRLQIQYSPARQAAVEKAYVLLGLLGPGENLIQTYLDSFLKSVQGYYDPDSKTLVLAGWVDPQSQEMTMAHELTHALQDQSFSLNAYFAQVRNETMDSEFAQSSLVEGQAVLVAAEYWTRRNSEAFIRPSGVIELADPQSLGKSTDDSTLETMGAKGAIDFPYVYGPVFLKTCLKEGGAKDLGWLFKNAPTTTQQILHPEDFMSGRRESEWAEPAELEQGFLRGYSKFWEDSMGEYGLFLVLRQYLDDDKAWKAVDGWRGDRLRAYENPEKRQKVLMGYVLMKDTASAKLFFKSYGELLADKYGKFKNLNSGDGVERFDLPSDENQVYLERSGRRIVFLEGIPAEDTQAVRQALLGSKSATN